MLIIDVYAPEGLFPDKHALAHQLAFATIKWSKAPPIDLYLDNTVCYVHEVSADAFSDAAGNSTGVRIQVLVPAGVFGAAQQDDLVRGLTHLVVEVVGDVQIMSRIWCTIIESTDGGWGVGGFTHTKAQISAIARREMSARQSPPLGG